MTSFDKGMWRDGRRPAAAPRAALFEMWRQKRRESPYFRAGFTLRGEWRRSAGPGGGEGETLLI